MEPAHGAELSHSPPLHRCGVLSSQRRSPVEHPPPPAVVELVDVVAEAELVDAAAVELVEGGSPPGAPPPAALVEVAPPPVLAALFVPVSSLLCVAVLSPAPAPPVLPVAAALRSSGM
ncbi:hypothetical protein WME97_28665 [Sorangium sp. So ce367]|uniref:hypothetical protein n=1 Tax=Sorangium sp. So ce367 TaxID=3133305 RepID=UPI003F62C1EF